jgi:hypothetical protein
VMRTISAARAAAPPATGNPEREERTLPFLPLRDQA